MFPVSDVKDLIEQAKELMQWADEYGIDEISLKRRKARDHNSTIKLDRGLLQMTMMQTK